MAETKLIIDGHVHIYDCYDLDRFFDATIENLDKAYLSKCPGDYNAHRVIFLTESKKNDYFSMFKRKGRFSDKSEYTFADTEEDSSLVLLKNNQPLCYLFAGRQIVTKEKLEVLSIASTLKIEDGLPIEEVIKKIFDNNGIAVLAWGVGKWFFKRGDIIRDIIKKYHSANLFIGDSGSRPSLWPKPQLYKIAESYNMKILLGSDPFPFPEEQSRVGECGILIDGSFNINTPVNSVLDILLSFKAKVSPLGTRDNIFRFFKRQIRMSRA